MTQENTNSPTIEILSFEVDTKRYAFDILSVTDILEIPQITAVPKTPPYLTGIMNLRGKAVPVMDFRLRLGLPKGSYDEKSCLIVIEINSLQCAITVDRVLDAQSIRPEQIAVSPTQGGMVSCFISTGESLSDRIALIDPEKLVRG